MSRFIEKILRRRKRGFKEIPAQFIREEWGLSELGQGEKMRRRRVKQVRKRQKARRRLRHDLPRLHN